MLEYEEFKTKMIADAQNEVSKCEKNLRFAKHNLEILSKCYEAERNKI